MSKLESVLRRWSRALRRWWLLLPLADTVKGGLACAVPAMIAALLHEPLWCWSAIAAFWGCLADAADAPRGRRTRDGALFALCGALASGVAVALHKAPVVEVVLAGLVVYAAALQRGSSAQLGQRALLVATAFSVSAAFPTQGAPQALAYAAHFLAGGLWAVLCNAGLSRTDAGRSVQRAARAYFHEAASYIAQRADSPARGRGTFGSGRAELRRRLDALHSALRVAPGTHGWDPSLSSLGATGEAALSSLAALETLLADASSPSERKALRTLLKPVLEKLSRRFEQGAERLAGRASPADPAADAMPSPDQAGLEQRAWFSACLVMIDELRGIADQVQHLSPPALREPPVPPPAAPSARTVLAEAMQQVHTQGRWARHAARTALATAIALALALLPGVPHGYWLVITAVWVMQPSFSQTLKISGLRLGGTALGAALASALEWLLPTPLLLGGAIFPLATWTLAARTVSYLSYILFLTPQFVLVAQLGDAVGVPWALALSRLQNSIVGALIGIAVSRFVWPEWDRHQLQAARAKALHATRAYLSSVLPRAAEAAAADTASGVRRQACVAVDELEAVLQGMRLEGEAASRRVTRAAVTVARLRRLIGAASLLEGGHRAAQPEIRQHAVQQLSVAQAWLR